jgi:pyridinium-3,5-biscarboxylic acid mononucleotide sulfurtransferase
VTEHAAPALSARLEARIRSYDSPHALVAFSGGVDSAVVLASAARALGPDAVTAVTAISPSFPSGELRDAASVAAAIGTRFRTVRTHEVEDPAYARNDALRCFHCKTELYGVLRRVAQESVHTDGGNVVVMAGANTDDRDDFRPGLRAASDFGIRNPLLEEGLGKRDVRAIARALGLAVADKPAMACLSSRVAFGVAITPDLLERIDAAEARVRGLGFEQVRVRHHGDRAVIEVEPSAVPRLRAHRERSTLIGELRALGWRDVDIDPAGYRAGAINATLVDLRRRVRRPVV